MASHRRVVACRWIVAVVMGLSVAAWVEGPGLQAGVLSEAQYVPPENTRADAAALVLHQPSARPAHRAAPTRIAEAVSAGGNLSGPTPHWQPPPPVHLFGYPVQADPLFDTDTRPDWSLQHLELQQYVKPAYDRPDYEKPLDGREPYRWPTLERPMYVWPNDNKPSNNIRNFEAPAVVNATAIRPVDIGPNVVIRPETAPAYDHPTYDHPWYDRPEWLAPVYDPQEYDRRKDVPPPYIGPPH